MKSIKEVSDREIFGCLLSIICVIFTGVGYLVSVGIMDIGPIPTYQIAGSMLMVGGIGFYTLALLTLRTEKFNNEIERLESRIDFLEDTLDEHAEVIDDNRDKINRITDFMWGECGLPNESQEYTSEDPRAEKKESS